MIGDVVHDAGIPEILTTDLGYGKIDGFNYRETLGKYGHFFRFGNQATFPEQAHFVGTV